VGTARSVALGALVRIERDGAYANLVLPAMLDRSGLAARDRAFATELVYGTVRMRAACDWLVDRFLLRSELEIEVRSCLRMGAYQLAFAATSPHAAVGETVGVAPRRARGLVNAVLRRVAEAPRDWPDDATRLSYPAWIVEQLRGDLGDTDAMAALEAMNVRPTVTRRADGYVQDRASQLVAAALAARPGERIVDLCAAPGGKATALAGAGAWVAAGDVAPRRLGLVAANAERLGLDGEIAPVVADAARPPFHAGTFDRVLLDAPCSGLGVLARRPDARWKVAPDAPVRLGRLQRELAGEAAALVHPGGVLGYSVCTMTSDETLGVDEHLAAEHPELLAEDPPGPPWRPHGRGALLLPQVSGTDGMYLLLLRRAR
jgi:16S rRNA (cytosine967-C5)-methyltransferase